MQTNKLMVAMIALVGLLLLGSVTEISGTHLDDGELGHDDGEVDAHASLGPLGHAVFFSNDGKLNIYGINICGARYDDASREFDIEIWDNNLKMLYSTSYDYADFFPDTYSPPEDSDLLWVTIDIPDIEVNGNFYVTIFTYSGPPSWVKGEYGPHPLNGGIEIGRDSDTKSGNSFVVDKNPNRIVDWETLTWNIRQDDTDWMMRVVTAQGTSASKTIYVDDDFTDDPINHKWNTIGEGIEDADSGDTIIVKSGRYPEHLEVDKQVTLRGEEYPVVDACGSGSAITLSESGITLEGFVAINSEDAGIKVTTNDNIVRGNRANSNKWGIRIYSSRNNHIEDNTASSNSYDGIHLLHSEHNTLISNNASNNYKDGIQLYSSSSNNITGNKVHKNDYVGIRLHSSTYNTIKGNDVGNNHGGGIEIKSSNHNNKIYHNNIIDNGREFQAYDDGNNQWDNGTGGNYWSDYRAKYPDAKERDESGIWDTPYDCIGDYETNEKIRCQR